MDKPQQIIHGTALSIFGYGVVIIGNSGSGKSELSLKLIDRGHKFIADDHVLIKKDHNKLWIHQHTQQFMHLGGIGFVDIIATYGKNFTTNEAVLCNLFIELENHNLDFNNRLAELSTQIDILGHKMPSTKLYIAQNRPLELLVEVLVKKQQQLDNGYNANQTFINNLKKSSVT